MKKSDCPAHEYDVSTKKKNNVNATNAAQHNYTGNKIDKSQVTGPTENDQKNAANAAQQNYTVNNPA